MCDEDWPKEYTSQCDEPEMESEKIITGSDHTYTIREFAETLLEAMGKWEDFEEKYKSKFLGVSINKVTVLKTQFPFYQRAQALYALSVFPFQNKDCKVIKTVRIGSSSEVPPHFESIRVRRTKKLNLLVIGHRLLKWKGKKMMLEVYFDGCACIAKLWFKTSDVENATDFQLNLVKFMRKNNFYKGERLVYLSRSEIGFLEFPKLDWNDVILKDDIKETLTTNIIFPLSNEKKCTKMGIPYRRGLLMAGVAGTGKTQVCRILCNVLPNDVTLIWATPKALYDEDQIQALFEAARYFSPTVIIIEDIDFIGTSRDFVHNPILGELLTQLDGNDPNHGIFVLATTNRPQYLDEALANRPSRFDVKVEFKLPDKIDRLKLIRLFSERMNTSHINLGHIANLSDGLTGAHIKEVLIYGQLKALKDGEELMKESDLMERIKQHKTEKDGSASDYSK